MRTRRARQPLTPEQRTDYSSAETETYRYIEELRSGEHGDIGLALLREYFPNGPMTYSLLDRLACCSRIESELRRGVWYIDDNGTLRRAFNPAQVAKDRRDLFGP